jgi:hypothetical protein
MKQNLSDLGFDLHIAMRVDESRTVKGNLSVVGRSREGENPLFQWERRPDLD